jgi:hypothetical protein
VLTLPVTLQAMDVLMIDKNVLKEAGTRARICPDIPPKLLLNFLMLFKPDECPPPTPTPPTSPPILAFSRPLSQPVVFIPRNHRPAQSLTTPPTTSFFPEPVDPGLLQMVDQEACSHDGDSHSSGADSLQEVLFKQPAVKPPAVAVNMCLAPDLMPPTCVP